MVIEKLGHEIITLWELPFSKQIRFVDGLTIKSRSKTYSITFHVLTVDSWYTFYLPLNCIRNILSPVLP